ncbi:class I SAM-dependent methyltransferase [Microbacterium sp. HJ5]
MSSREEMSRSFGAAAGAYESGRPEYPGAAVEWMLEPVRREGRALRVADVGAGTGKLTRAIVESGADVVAIDPDAGMLASLRENVHGVPTFVGTAERMPLPDASVDALLLGQAWHWVDPPVAAAECGRVVRSGGVLGLIWNVRDESDAFVRGLTAIMHPSSAEQMIADGGPTVAAPFGPLEKRTWGWTRTMTRNALLDMVASRSYVITAEPGERERVMTEIAALFDGASRQNDDGLPVVELPYRTEAFRGIRA